MKDSWRARRVRRHIDLLAEQGYAAEERDGVIVVTGRIAKNIFPAPVADPPADPTARARALERSAEVRAGVRRFLAALTSPSPSDGASVT